MGNVKARNIDEVIKYFEEWYRYDEAAIHVERMTNNDEENLDFLKKKMEKSKAKWETAKEIKDMLTPPRPGEKISIISPYLKDKT